MTQSPAEGMLPDFAPCPTCKQYCPSVTLTGDAHEAFMSLTSMDAHPVRGHPMAYRHEEEVRGAVAKFAAAYRAAEARTRAAGWQPIETAPKIELEYILASNGFWVEKVCFVPRTEGDGREGPGWIAHHGDVTPTHWMPLPKPSPRAALPTRAGS